MIADSIKEMLRVYRRGLKVDGDPAMMISFVSLGLWQRLRDAFLMYPFDSYYPEIQTCKSKLRAALNSYEALYGR